MAEKKPTFAKLKLAKNSAVKAIEFNNFEIEVKQYLPVDDKLQLISNVINYSADDNNFANPVKVELFGTLEIIYFYTNITFTDKQKEDSTGLFDTLLSSGLVKAVIDAIPGDEYTDLITWIDECVEAVYTYRHSMLGILDVISQDYSNLSLNVDNLTSSMRDPDNLQLLKDVLTKIG